MKRTAQSATVLAIAIIATAGCGLGKLRDETPLSKPGSEEAAAKAVANQFVYAVSHDDRKSALSCVGVPYFNLHDFSVITDASDLEQRYSEVFSPWIDSGGFQRKITQIRRYSEQREAIPAGPRAMLDKVLDEDDFVLMLGSGAEEERYLLIRVIDGDAKIVGVATR